MHPAYKTFNADLDITETEINREKPLLTSGYHQHICDNYTHGDISNQRGAGSTM